MIHLGEQQNKFLSTTPQWVHHQQHKHLQCVVSHQQTRLTSEYPQGRPYHRAWGYPPGYHERSWSRLSWEERPARSSENLPGCAPLAIGLGLFGVVLRLEDLTYVLKLAIRVCPEALVVGRVLLVGGVLELLDADHALRINISWEADVMTMD